jgi:hypothetical protein
MVRASQSGMKIFISWSGPLAKKVAELLSAWLQDVLQDTETWMSAEDIDKGSIWFGDIREKLAETKFGILCLTRENKIAPWILFEAGGLSKGLTKNRVCPLLIDLETKELDPPLSQFNSALPNKEDMWKLIKTINAGSEKGLPEVRVKKAFEQWWGEFEKKFKIIRSDHTSSVKGPEKSTDEMVAEILEISRATQRNMQKQDFRGVGTFDLGSGIGNLSGLSIPLVASPVRHVVVENKTGEVRELGPVIDVPRVESSKSRKTASETSSRSIKTATKKKRTRR